VKIINSYFNKGGIFKLFLVCAFPIHVWSIVMFLRDFDWISERTNSWDAVGVGGYALLLALLESFIIFVLFFILSFLVHKTWQPDTRLAIMSVLMFVISLWAIFTQGFFLLGGMIPNSIYQFLVNSSHPFRYLYGTMWTITIITVVVPVFLLLRSKKLVKAVLAVIERIILLSGLYLVFDFIGIVIVIVRNVVTFQ
jgi:hypothetical protein